TTTHMGHTRLTWSCATSPPPPAPSCNCQIARCPVRHLERPQVYPPFRAIGKLEEIKKRIPQI
uniref:Uncharacterized protein n=1 Tax=Aegilops tauschii subsp. strangulata TaxID=200361 RepID=A0A453C6E1_AEGTS